MLLIFITEKKKKKTHKEKPTKNANFCSAKNPTNARALEVLSG